MATMYGVNPRGEISLDDQLRLELGWTEVAQGLLKILLGYGILVAGLLVGGLLAGTAILQMGGFGRGPVRLAVGSLWQFYIGMGIVSLTGLFCWATVLAGKWKVLLNVPERHQARWLMFVCVTCTFVGPTFNTAAGIGFSQRPVQLQRGPFGLMEMRLNTTGRVIHLIGFACGLLGPLAYQLFLRAVARCLELKGHVHVLNGFVAVSVGLMAVTCYVLFFPPASPRLLVLYALALLGGWLLYAIAYVVMTIVMRTCILEAVQSVRSPLDARA